MFRIGRNPRSRRRSLALAAALLAAAQAGTFPVSRVIDGDTIEVRLGDRRERVRYIGIDTPESVHPTRAIEPYALAAEAANRRLVEGRRVRLELDVQERDRYGRLLAYVWVDSILVNEWLVRHGFALISTYPPNVRYVDRFRAAQTAAREEGRGLWSAPVRPRGPDGPAVRARLESSIAARLRPSADAPVVRDLPKDGVVIVQRCRGEWCFVRHSGDPVWVPKRSLREEIDPGG